MKKRFTPLAALCSAMLLSSGMYAMEAEVAEDTTSHAVICKAFSKRLKMSRLLLEQTNSKIEALQTNEEAELTKEEQDKKDKIALIKDKVAATITNLTSVRANLKDISPDSWGEWMLKKFSSNKVEAGQEEDDIIVTSATQLQAIKLFVDEFIGNHLPAIKESSDKEEAVQSIKDTLNEVLADIKEVNDAVTVNEVITLTNLFKSIVSFLQN